MNGWHKFVVIVTLLLPVALHAQLVVDCTGADKNAYPNINAALADAGPGATIYVTGPCNEEVTLENLNGLSLGAWPGQAASLNGGIVISDSKLIYL